MCIMTLLDKITGLYAGLIQLAVDLYNTSGSEMNGCH